MSSYSSRVFSRAFSASSEWKPFIGILKSLPDCIRDENFLFETAAYPAMYFGSPEESFTRAFSKFFVFSKECTPANYGEWKVYLNEGIGSFETLLTDKIYGNRAKDCLHEMKKFLEDEMKKPEVSSDFLDFSRKTMIKIENTLRATSEAGLSE